VEAPLRENLAAGIVMLTGWQFYQPLLDPAFDGILAAHYTRGVRIEAARALGEVGDSSAIPALFAALNDSSAVVVHLAEIGLERLGVGMVFFEP